VSMRATAHPHKRPWSGGLRLLMAGLLGVAAAVALVSCGSSGKGLIPLANAGPLQSDFEAVAQAAQTGDGNCTATTAAINKTEQDFAALPATIDTELRSRLSQGIANLRERALALCTQPLAQTTTSAPRTTTTTTPTKTQATTTPTTTPTTPTPTTPTTPTPTTPNNGGGTVAPGSESPAGGEAGVGESGGAGIQEGVK
jgi:type IV secretory pathway VirJ component